jgi:hypothetical protein
MAVRGSSFAAAGELDFAAIGIAADIFGASAFDVGGGGGGVTAAGVGTMPHGFQAQPPDFLVVGVVAALSDEPVEVLDKGRSRSNIPMLDLRYEELSPPVRESTGLAVVKEELRTGSVDTNDRAGLNGASDGRGRKPPRDGVIMRAAVIVIWEGRDLRVWISIPDMERMDSWDVERRRVGWNANGSKTCSV